MEVQMTLAHPGRVLPQDITPQDGWDEMNTAQPVSPAEIDELLYGEDRPAAERLARLREIAGELRAMEPADFGDDDPGVLLGQIDEAIAKLSGALDRDPQLIFDEVSADEDPLAHRETLAPDSDELEEIEEDDEDSLTDEDAKPLPDEALNPDDILDPKEWNEGDGFDVDKGVR
jgi:hypothetical protein